MDQQEKSATPSRERRWRNAYIDRCRLLPERLLSCEGRHPSPSELSWITTRCVSPTILECGSGSGAHIIERALRDGSHHYLGIEQRYKRAFRTAEKSGALRIPNISVIRGDLLHILPLLPSAMFSGIFINFPDPWDRRKWTKHRMLSSRMLSLYARLLSPGGFLSYKTDHRGYFQDTLTAFDSALDFKVRTVSFDLHNSPLVEGNVLTEFENLFLSQGTSICYLLAERLQNSVSEPSVSSPSTP